MRYCAGWNEEQTGERREVMTPASGLEPGRSIKVTQRYNAESIEIDAEPLPS